MEINKNRHLSFNAVAYRQLDPDGGANDTLAHAGGGACDTKRWILAC